MIVLEYNSSVFIPSNYCPDKLVWGLNRDGIYTVKYEVTLLQNMNKYDWREVCFN